MSKRNILNILFRKYLKEKLLYLQTIGEQIKEKANNKMQNSALIKQLEELKLDIINKKDMLQNRLINAFPNVEMPKFNNTLEELKIAIHKHQYQKKTKRKKNSNIDKKDNKKIS